MNFDERIRAILINRFKRAANSVFRYLSYKKDPNVKDNFGTTLLHMVASASLDNLAIVHYLLDLGANINIQDNNHLTPLHLAVSENNYKIADFLVAQGAAVNIQEKNGKTALHLLIDNIWLQKSLKERDKQKRRLLLVKKLLQSGADPNLPDIYGETPLMRAVRQNDFDIVKELLMFGGNVHLRNTDSDTCLHLLLWSFEPNKNILVELVKHGACVNCFGSQGKSVIDFVLQYYPAKRQETVKLLIKTSILVHWKNKLCFEIEANHESNCLVEFIDSCYTEVSQMKTCSYSDKSNLCHFALHGGNASQKEKSSGKSLFNEVLDTLIKYNFPIYEDFIRAHFDRSFMLEKSLKMNIYARNAEKKVLHLNSDIIFEVVPYLSDNDLFHLVKAYSKPDVLCIKNDNQLVC